MLNMLFNWLIVAGFAGAGLFNAVGPKTQQETFVRWGYPRWWCRATGLLEMAAAVLIAIPASQVFGQMLASTILIAAAFTVLHHREFSHLMPIGVFAVTLIAANLQL